jgi:probable rRNA maturation factor
VSGSLVIRNQQRVRRVDLRCLRKIVRSLLKDELRRNHFDLGIYLVGEAEMTRLNETHLHHRGSTDVITFDYCDPRQSDLLAGEIVVCVPEGVAQARRFRTTWQREVIRYAVHGVLHLCGYDDRSSRLRRAMKREENRLLKRLTSRFELPA